MKETVVSVSVELGVSYVVLRVLDGLSGSDPHVAPVLQPLDS